MTRRSAEGIPLADEQPASCSVCPRRTDPDASRVTLLGGTVVCTWCPAWKAECARIEPEARRVLGLLNVERRRAELSAIEAKRGAAYRARLEAGIMALWSVRRPQPVQPAEPA